MDKARISAQSYKNELDSLKDKLLPEKLPKAKAKATAIYNLKEIIGIVALQEPSPEKEATLKTLNKRYIKEERRFYREFGITSPVSEAVIDKSAKESIKKQIFKINAVNSIKKGAKIVNRTFSSVVTPKIEIQAKEEKKPEHKSDLAMSSFKKTIKKISKFVNSRAKIQSTEKPREKTSKATAAEMVQTLDKLSKEFSFKRIYLQPPAAKGKSSGKDDTGMGM